MTVKHLAGFFLLAGHSSELSLSHIHVLKPAALFPGTAAPSCRAHLRQRLPEGEEGSLRLEELSSAATSRSSLLASRRASLSGTPRSGASSASNSVAAGALDAAATAAAAADLLPSSAAQAPSSAGSTGTPSVRDATRRHLLESRQSLQQLGDSRHASAEALQPLVVPRQQQQQQGGLQPPPTLPAAMAPTLAEEQRQEVAAAETREVVGAAAIALFEIRPEDCLVGERLAVGGFAEVFVGRYQVRVLALPGFAGFGAELLAAMQWTAALDGFLCAAA